MICAEHSVGASVEDRSRKGTQAHTHSRRSLSWNGIPEGRQACLTCWTHTFAAASRKMALKPRSLAWAPYGPGLLNSIVSLSIPLSCTVGA